VTQLTEQERHRFALWLQEDAREMGLLIKQMEKLPGMDAMIKTYKTRAMARVIVARELMETESQTVGEEPTPT